MKRAVAFAAVVLLTACGNTADPALRRAAEKAQISTSTVVAGPGGGSVSGTTGVAAPSSTTGQAIPGSTGGPTGVGVQPGSTGGTTTTGSSGPAVPAPVGGNGGATDVGITADSVTVGNVSDLSGPVPGLFQGAVIGTQAYFAKINAAGGVYGRQLKVAVGDGQLDCSANKAATTDLAPKVFAFVGSFSLYDNCGLPPIAAQPNESAVQVALSDALNAYPRNFAVAPLAAGWRQGPLNYYAHKYGDAWKHIGAIYANVGSSPAIWGHVKHAIASSGGAVVSEYGYGPNDTDFTAEVIRMQRDGVQLFFSSAVDGAYAAKFVNAARSQQVTWPIIFGGGAYDQTFLKQAGDNANGVFNDMLYARFFNADEAATIPAVKEYQTWMGRVGGNDVIKDLYSAYAWGSAQLFVDALKKAGPKPTRLALIKALHEVKSFDADGLLSPSGPGDKTPAACWILVQVVKGTWQRVDSPASTFRADCPYFKES
jgi:ABC-type branched-subunit amino acid transport system substrate-binding protein